MKKLTKVMLLSCVVFILVCIVFLIIYTVRLSNNHENHILNYNEITEINTFVQKMKEADPEYEITSLSSNYPHNVNLDLTIETGNMDDIEYLLNSSLFYFTSEEFFNALQNATKRGAVEYSIRISISSLKINVRTGVDLAEQHTNMEKESDVGNGQILHLSIYPFLNSEIASKPEKKQYVLLTDSKIIDQTTGQSLDWKNLLLF